MLASVNGQSIRAGQLDDAVRPQVEPLTRQIEKTREAALNGMIDNLVLQQAADSAGLTVEDYLKANLKPAAVTDEEVTEAYEQGKDRSPGFPAWEAKHRIRRGLEERRRSEALARLLEGLRKSAQIRNFMEEERAAALNLQTDESPCRGSAEAPVTVVVFSDFECPYCRRDQPLLRQILERWPEQVRLVYKHFPLEMHPNAFHAAVASVCAHRQGRFWEFQDVLFGEYRDLSKSGLFAAATAVALDADAFQKCVTSAAAAEEVQRDMHAAREADVDGTPAYFVNNRRLRGAFELEKAIADIVAQKH